MTDFEGVLSAWKHAQRHHLEPDAVYADLPAPYAEMLRAKVAAYLERQDETMPGWSHVIPNHGPPLDLSETSPVRITRDFVVRLANGPLPG